LLIIAFLKGSIALFFGTLIASVFCRTLVLLLLYYFLGHHPSLTGFFGPLFGQTLLIYGQCIVDISPALSTSLAFALLFCQACSSFLESLCCCSCWSTFFGSGRTGQHVPRIDEVSLNSIQVSPRPSSSRHDDTQLSPFAQDFYRARVIEEQPRKQYYGPIGWPAFRSS
jgi:hypothetical protein